MNDAPTFPTELLELLQPPGVSGYEGPVVDRIRSLLPSGLPVREDAIGNLVTTFGDEGPHLLLIVHTDEVGFVVSGIRPDGALYLTAVGHWDLASLGGTQIDVHTAAGPRPGVVITVPPHLDRGLAGPPAWLEGDQVVVDVGTESAEATASLGVAVLDSVTLARYHDVLPGGHLVARGLDNRFGCYLLVRLAHAMTTEPPHGCRVTLAWATQEEVGFRGPRVLARSSDFDAVLAVDAYPADRRPQRHLAVDAVRLGRGPVARGVDLSGVGSVRFVQGLVRLARERGLPIQPAYAQGHNQASVFPHSFAAALDLPVAYLHSGVESVHLADLEAAAGLLGAIVQHPSLEALWA